MVSVMGLGCCLLPALALLPVLVPVLVLVLVLVRVVCLVAHLPSLGAASFPALRAATEAPSACWAASTSRRDSLSTIPESYED